MASCQLTWAVMCWQCDGRPIPLPSLQGIAVLNIPSYAGGTNFWGGTKEDDVRTEPASLLQPVCLPVCLSSERLSVPLRPSPLPPLTIRSWRWWPCLAACRWSCPESSTCSTTASPRCSCPPAYHLSVRPSVCLSNLLCPSVSDSEDHHPG